MGKPQNKIPATPQDAVSRQVDPNKNFGIRNFLTEGTSDGNDREKEDDNGVLERKPQQDEEPWKLILG